MTKINANIAASLRNALDMCNATDEQKIAAAVEFAANMFPMNAEPQSHAWRKTIDNRKEFAVAVAGTCMRPVRHAMTGATVLESFDTPWSCSVASESYFCN
jgi:hypothetical protein